MRAALAFTLTLALALPLSAQKSKQVEVKVQKTSMTRDQEIALGKEAGAQVEREMEVLHNADIENWLKTIGQRLAKAPQANAYPYYFKLVNEPSINAFALPGGPMYVHTGLIAAADTEGEVAGVLAHEMSHVALRHGAAQMGKQQTWGTLFGVVGAVAGAAGCGLLCEAGQYGASIGGNGLLMKFSRGFEKDADLNGARMAAAVGYDPMNVPKFFEKLASKAGQSGEPKGLALWMSSHPASGSRAQYVSEDIKFYTKQTYSADTGSFPQVKKLVAALPPPKMKPAVLIQAKQGAKPRTNLPAGFADYQANGCALAYPSSWKIGQSQAGGSIFIVPQGGAAQGQNGEIELIAGIMVDYYVPQSGAAKLDTATKSFLEALRNGDPNLRYDRSENATLGGQPALVTRLTTKTSYQQDREQVIFLYTVAREAGLWHMVLAAPKSTLANFEPIAKQIVPTVQFPADQH